MAVDARVQRRAAAQGRRPERRWILAGSLLSLAGLVVSGYLAWAGAAAGVAGGPPADGGAAPGAGAAAGGWWCGPGSACQALWLSPYGRLAGLGLPVWGLVAFALLAGGGLWWASRPDVGLRAPVVALSWAAAGFAAYLIWLQLAALEATCPWCMVADGASLLAAVAFTGAALLQRRPAAAGPAAGAAGRRAASSPAAAGRRHWAAGPILAPALAGVLAAAVVARAHWVTAASAAGGPLPGLPGSSAQAPRLPQRLEQLEPLMAAGSPQAPARVDVYADFQCPYCAMAATEVIRPLLEHDVAQGRMRLVFHNFAFLGAESRWAAEAAVCAAAQERFWPFHDRLFAEQRGENVGTYRPERLVAMAREEGLDAEAFAACLQRRAARGLVEASYEAARRRGVRATPTFLVNGRLVEGLVPVQTIRRLAYDEAS